MSSKSKKSDVFIIVQHAQGDAGKPLDKVRDNLPDGLVGCLRICLSNLVPSNFFISTFDWVKRELVGKCDAAEAEAASQVAVNSLRAQSYKGADRDELEFMQIAAMDIIIDLNASVEFSSCDKLLDEIEEPSLEGLSRGKEAEAVATQVADAISAAYWNPVIKLVDVLIEVVGKKSEQKYEDAVREWRVQVDGAKKALAQSEEAEKQAKGAYEEVVRGLAKLEAELKSAKRNDEQKTQCARLLNEAKRAESDLAKAELSYAKQQESQKAKKEKMSELGNELAGLGLFAFDKKKKLKLEIEDLEKELSMIEESIKSEERLIDTFRKKAVQRHELEKRLAGYPASRVHEIEDEIGDVELKADLAYEQLKESEDERSKQEHQLRQKESERPKKSEYSAREAKRPLRWRPATRVAASGPSSSITPVSAASVQAGGFRRGTGSTWRDRRPKFYDSNPIHISSRTSTSSSGSRYTATIGYNIKLDDPDMTHRMDIDIEGPASAFDAANAFLANVSSAFRRRDYSGKYSFLRNFKCRRLPFTSIDTRLYVPKMDMDELTAAIGLIGAFNKECPQLKIDGIIEMVRSYAGIRSAYYVTSSAGDDTITAEQKVEGM